MNKILLLMVAVGLLSCAGSSKKKEIENYIRSNEPLVESLEIIEIGQKDSVYSPFDRILSATMASFDLADASQCDGSNPNRIAYIVPANLGDTYYSIDSILMDAMLFVDFDTYMTNEPNRVGVSAKYKLNGVLKEEVFFYNQDGESIGHTKADVRNSFKQLHKAFIPLKLTN